MAKMPEPQTDTDKIYRATITTDRGVIVMDLDPQLAPQTVNNFVGLARDGYYDGLTFHRVVPDFVIQGGCPEGSGRGGPGYKFADEPVKGQYKLGAVAMANSGPDTNGSQFFICIDDCQSKLAPSYNLFGYVVDGMDVALATGVGDVMRKVEIEERDRADRDSGCGRVDEPVAAADGAVGRPEHERVDEDPDDQDHDHRLEHADVVGLRPAPLRS